MSRREFSPHDHDTCIRSAVAALETQCAADGAKLTPVRRRVLEILLSEHRAMGAYEILDVLRGEGLGAQPPVAYRALEFLVKQGAVHKVEKRNAFIACNRPGEQHDPGFMICRSCDAVAETKSAPGDSALSVAAREAGFVIENTVVEAEGLCPNCRTSGVI